MSIRVLHLVDAAAGEEPLIAALSACAVRTAHHEVWLLGGSADERAARSLGLTPAARLSPPGCAPELAWRGARSLLDDRRRALGPAWPDAVHCTSVATLALARLLFRRATPRTASLSSPPPSQGSPLERLRFRFALEPGIDGPTLLTPTPALWRAWREAGVGDVRLAPPPGAASGAPSSLPRAKLRSLCGLADADKATSVIALLADPASEADARAFVFILGLVHTTGRRTVGVVPRGSMHVRRAARFVRNHGRRWGLVEADGPMLPLLRACDAAIWPAPRRGGAALARFAASNGVPIILPGKEDASELASTLPPAARLHVAINGDLRSMAAALLPVLDAAGTAAAPRGAPDESSLDAAAPARQEFPDVLAEIWREAVRTPVSEAAHHPLAALSAAGAAG